VPFSNLIIHSASGFLELEQKKDTDRRKREQKKQGQNK
jgi:hypothetical protein